MTFTVDLSLNIENPKILRITEPSIVISDECVCERERERGRERDAWYLRKGERERGGERERQRETHDICI